MKDFSRRDFLRTCLFTSGTFFISLNPLTKILASSNANANEVTNSNETDTTKLQKQAREYFYKKDYQNAELSYRQLILLLPTYITAYDGLAKTLYAQNKSLAAAEAYRQGWLDHKDNYELCDRLGRAMKRLVLGNSTQEKEFCFRIGKTELLELAAELYIGRMESADPKVRKFLTPGLLDVHQALEIKNQSLGFQGKELKSFSLKTEKKIQSLTKSHRSKWEASRKKHKKNEYNVKSESEAETRILKTQNRKKRELYFEKEQNNRDKEESKNIKQLNSALFNIALKNGSTKDVEKYRNKIIAIDSNDNNATGQLINHYRKNKQYTKLIDLQRELYEKDRAFWPTISYAQSLRLKAKKESVGHLYLTAQKLYEQFLDKTDIEKCEHVALYGGLLDCYIQQNNFTELRSCAIKALSVFPLSYLPFIITYIKSWTNEGKIDIAEKAFKMLLSGSETPEISNDPIYSHIKTIHKIIMQPTGKPNEVSGFGINKESLFDIYYGMAALYIKSDNRSALADTLNKIKRIDPENSFVKKILRKER